MIRTPLLFIHIAGALVALLAGWTAMFLRKGSRRHGMAGNVFVIAMLGMCACGVALAAMKEQAGNVVAGTLTFYLVGTAWLTARRREGETGRLELGAMLVAFAVGITTLTLGWQVTHSAARPKDGVPAAVYFIFGSVALFSAAGDARMILRGGVFGGPRIARHLWRMCTALLMATLSGLAGQRTHIFPEVIRKAHFFNIPVLTLPVLVLPILIIFWLFRVRLSKRYKRNGVAPRIKPVPANTLA
jgi:hypothetical protein